MKPSLQVLIIEDSEDDSFLILHKIEKAGYSVNFERVDTAQAVRKALKEKTWDIILSDYAMPQFNGLEALEIMKEMGFDLPFIIISGTIGEDVAVNAMKMGAHDYIMKNNPQRLLPAIERELREAQTRSEHRLLEQKKQEAEEALRESEKRYRRITEGLTDYLYSVQVENGQPVSTIQGVACHVLTGYTSEEFQDDPYLWLNMVVPDDRDKVREHVQKILDGIEVPPLEHRIRCKSGIIKWVCDTNILIKDNNGNLISYDGVIKDITERKHAENELRKLSRALEQSPVSVIITDTNGNIEYVNPKFTEVTGYSADEVLGQNPRIFKTGNMTAYYYNKMWQMLASGKVWFGEFQNKKKNGEFFWELASITPVFGSNGEITNYLAVKEDITNRKIMETALADSERKYRIVADNTFNWEFWLSPDNKFIYCSPSCFRLTGYTAEEFINDSQLQIEIIHPEYRTEYINQVINRPSDVDKIVSQFKIIHKNGAEVWIEHISQPVYDANGKLLGHRGSNCDITDKKETERKILRAIISAEENERNKLSQELHDGLGPMLSIVKLYFEWLAETEEPEKRRGIIATGLQNIDDAIMATKEISNRLSPRMLTQFGLIAALKQLVAKINVTQKLFIDLKSNVEIRYDPQIEITLYRILSELINNTLKYAQAKNVNILIQPNCAKELLSVVYTDDGKGFSYNEVIKTSKGMGIQNMIQRIKSLKGLINFNTEENSLMKVVIVLPLNANTNLSK